MTARKSIPGDALEQEPLHVHIPGSQLPTRRALPPFETLRAFDAIARLGGVRKAAQYLCRDHAVLSRHMRALEGWTGVKLIQRTAAGTVLTEEGLRYHADIASALNLIARSTIDLIKRGDNHCLHIRCMPGFALHWLSGRLGSFERAHPDVDVELQPANRSPEFLSPETDIEIRFVGTYRPPLELPAELSSTALARVPIIGVASPDYLQAMPPIRTPRDLLRHNLLHEQDFETWRAWLAAHGVTEVVELQGPRLWQGHLTMDAARFARGIALTNMLIVAEDIAEGRLVEVGRDQPSFKPRSDGIYHFIARTNRWDSSVVSKFRHWLIDTIATQHPDLAIKQTATGAARQTA